MAALPRSVKYLVIGAGVHGLSTAWHLGKEQRARGEEPDVLIVDKTGIGAGASGIACGVVRNNYYQPAMSELMAANVEVWEQDPAAFSYHDVGYMALGCSTQVSDLTEVHRDQHMWTYWYLQEGEITVDPKLLSLPDGSMPPVLHVDSDAPLYDDDGHLITDELWGNYFKQDLHGVQGGAAPLIVGHEFEVDPYPTASVDSSFADMWCASLSHCMERFEGKRGTYANVRSGGVGCFTADSFPVFDYMRPNVYVVADSNHGYKMIGVGREVAQVMTGGHSGVLYPFRYERFATGDLHPVSNSPYPWS
jgi:glycine/D-amino acid oxidase-like deaminating enzyme